MNDELITIYKITTEDGEVYVGQTANLKARLFAHRSSVYGGYLGSKPVRPNQRITHEVLAKVTQEQADDEERAHILAQSKNGPLANSLNGGCYGQATREAIYRLTPAKERKVRGSKNSTSVWDGPLGEQLRSEARTRAIEGKLAETNRSPERRTKVREGLLRAVAEGRIRTISVKLEHKDGRIIEVPSLRQAEKLLNLSNGALKYEPTRYKWRGDWRVYKELG
jgi:predicted GIY-YIG superfamily endonuclease